MTMRSLMISLGLAAVASLGAAQAADAAAVTLWACHGPSGQALGAGALTPSATADGVTTGAGCAGPTGGLSATFGRPDPAAASGASWRADVPSGTTLSAVRIDRSTSGFGGTPVTGAGQRYVLETDGGALESADLSDPSSDQPLTGTATFATAGAFVRLGVACSAAGPDPCAAPPSGTVGVEASRLALTVDDADAPHVAVGGVQSPASDTLALTVRATDTGLGLDAAAVTLDGAPVAGADLRTPGCTELSPDDATPDLALDATCAHLVQDVSLPVDTVAVADGTHRLVVTVRDVAGNVTTAVDEDISVSNHRTPSTSTATLDIGGGGGTGGGGGNGGGGGGSGGGGNGGGGGSTVPPASGWTTCLAPQLSVMLSQKPLRVSHGVVVLQQGKRYRFTGRLTCSAGTARRSAPKGTVVNNFNVVGGHTIRKSGVTVRTKGKLTALLTYRSSRTLVFTYRALDHTTAKVSIKIRVARR